MYWQFAEATQYMHTAAMSWDLALTILTSYLLLCTAAICLAKKLLP